MNKIKKGIMTFGVLWVIVAPIMLLIIVYICQSFLSGSIVVTIDTINEADIEILIITFLSFCSSYLLYEIIKRNSIGKVENKFKQFILLCGYIWGYTSIIIMDIILFKAYMSPSKSTVFMIDDISLLIISLFSICGSYLVYWSYVKNTKLEFFITNILKGNKNEPLIFDNTSILMILTSGILISLISYVFLIYGGF